MKLPNSYKERCLAWTSTGQKIIMYSHGEGRFRALLIGGVHGDESEGFLLAEKFIAQLKERKLHLRPEIKLYACARLNPDGCKNLRRTNHNNIDLNRNLPSKDWQGNFENVRYYPGPKANSEIESKITVKLIKKIKPHLIISLHSYERPMVNFNGLCENLAFAMSQKNGLIAKSDIGYPTPGSLGSYAGWERKIPTITLEIERGQNEKNVWECHAEGLVAGLEFYL